VLPPELEALQVERVPRAVGLAVEEPVVALEAAAPEAGEPSKRERFCGRSKLGFDLHRV
jgi:hypothetical protein